jgi:hypothetical protein
MSHRLRLFLLVALSLLPALPAAAQQWKSPLWGRDYLLIDKEPGAEAAEVTKILGPDTVDYEAFTASYVPRESAAAVGRALEQAGVRYGRVADRWETLARRAPERSTAWSGLGVKPSPIPGLYLARFAFPVRPEWLKTAAACGAEVKAVLDSATVLVRSGAPGALLRCGGFRYLAWLDPFSTADRVAPEVFAEADAPDPDIFSLQFFPGTAFETALASLPPGMEVTGSDSSPMTGSLFLQVKATREEILQAAEESAPLLAVTRRGQDAPSDERQGQILAGNHNGTAVTAPGYLTWLSGRGLSSAANQQTVAVFDTGYDDGTAAGPHHPDLENPNRYLDGTFYTGSSLTDTGGHGTMVAGIISGNGAAGVGSGAADCQGFAYGTGIAPQTKLVPVKIFHYNSTGTVSNSCSSLSGATDANLRAGFIFSRNTGTGANKALLSNHSWNSSSSGYTSTSALYDEMVVDANSNLNGAQPMTVVVSAGNAGANNTSCTTTPIYDSVKPPATAKNVITVGATENYRPVSMCQPPAGCGAWCSTLAQDATNINRLAYLSSKGKYFERWDVGDPPLFTPQYAHNVRIKPDLVAPGIRITSTVPYLEPTFTCTNALCTQFYPASPLTYHSYAQGTSFAAPAVTGAAALLRKYLLDRGIDAAPSLVKAVLVATADDLGNFVDYNGDHRPSHFYGWGRVNVNRATDGTLNFYQNESTVQAVSTGQERSFTVTLSSPTKDTYIVLTWSDPPSVTGTSQVGLVNDLRLKVEEGLGAPFWQGNNFEENKNSGVDNGYSHHFVLGGDPVLEDSINTVEAVFIPANTFPANKQLTIKVTGVSVAQGPQKFSVFGYNVH